MFSKWYHDTIYCLPMSTIKRRIDQLWNMYKEGKKRLKEGRMNSEAVQCYTQLVHTKESLFDIAAKTDDRRITCEKEWGVK